MSNKNKKNVGGKFRPRGKSGDSSTHTRNTDSTINSSNQKENILKDYSTLTALEQKSAKQDLEDLSIKGEVLGYILSPLGFKNLVVHNPSYSYPIIVKELNFRHSFNQTQEDNLNSHLLNFASLELNQIIRSGNRTFLKLTYSLNTLQYALNS